MKKLIFTIAILSVAILYSVEPHFMIDPAISPDGTKICFSYMEDLWLVDAQGGIAKRLTSTKGNDFNPVYSNDGKYIYFNSDREGWRQIYRIAANGGLAELINSELGYLLDSFPDGSLIVRMRSAEFRNRFFRVYPDGDYHLLTDFGGEYAGVDKSGDKIVFSRKGDPYREKYTGSANGDLWEYNIKKEEFSRITTTNFTERYPQYTTDGEIYAATADGEVFQIYKYAEGQKATKLTNLKTWSARDLSVAKKTNDIVFEVFDEIWLYQANTKKAMKVEIEIKEDYLEDFTVKKEFHNKVDKFAVSPNNKLIVFSYKFDLFAVPEKGGEVKQLTFSQTGIENIVIMDDNQTIYFTSSIQGNPIIFRTKIDEIGQISKMKWSEDKYIYKMKKENNQLIVSYDDKNKDDQIAIIDPDDQKVLTLTNDDEYARGASTSPDFTYAFFIRYEPGIWSNHLVSYHIKTGHKESVFSFDGYLSDVIWGTDKKTAFISIDEEIHRIDLVAKDDFFSEKDNWKEIIEPDTSSTKDSKKEDPVDMKIDFENIDQRFTKLVKRDGWNSPLFVKKDSILYYLCYEDKEHKLYSINYNGENDELVYNFKTQLKSIKYNKNNESVYFVTNQTLKKLKVDSKKVTTILNDFDYIYDSFKLNSEIFYLVWTKFGRGFYDKDMHGVNWGKMKEKYSPYLSYGYNPDILATIVEEMIGEVNASHTGFYPRKESKNKKYSIAYPGMEFDFFDYPKDGIRISKVYRNSKIKKPFDVKVGDRLLAVDDIPIGNSHNITPLFADKVGEKIKLTIAAEDSVKTIEIKGLSFWKHYGLFYDNWVEERRKKVEKYSNGKIGYAHIQSMNNSSYEKFWQDVYAKNYNKKALIIDVRNNGGGYTHDRLVEMLTKRTYAYNTWQSFGDKKFKSPGNVWEKPLALLINENSFSDAEIFPALFQEFELGKVIGMPTSGSVIGTGHIEFMDGSSMRMPSTGWFTKHDVNLEGTGAMPDILVEPTPKQIIEDDDIQLKRAVDELMKEL